MLSCAQSESEEIKLVLKQKEIVSGQQLSIDYYTQKKYDNIEIVLEDKNSGVTLEKYGKEPFKNTFIIKRFLLNEKGKHEDVRLNEKIEKNKIKILIKKLIGIFYCAFTKINNK